MSQIISHLKQTRKPIIGSFIALTGLLLIVGLAIWPSATALAQDGPASQQSNADFDAGTTALEDENIGSAIESFTRACDDQHLPSCASLGKIYQNNGKGVFDPDRSVELFAKACDGGYMPGCVDLGAQLMVFPSSDDIARAYITFTKACDSGNLDGCAHLGNLYMRDRNFSTALELLTKACNGENTLGCFNLARLYETATFGQQNFDRAREAYESACHKNHYGACYGLSTLLGTVFDDHDGRATYVSKACEISVEQNGHRASAACVEVLMSGLQ